MAAFRYSFVSFSCLVEISEIEGDLRRKAFSLLLLAYLLVSSLELKGYVGQVLSIVVFHIK